LIYAVTMAGIWDAPGGCGKPWHCGISTIWTPQL